MGILNCIDNCFGGHRTLPLTALQNGIDALHSVSEARQNGTWSFRSALLSHGDENKPVTFFKFVLVLLKCTTCLQKTLFLTGVLVAMLTGLCQPFMSYTFGELAQVLVYITRAVNNKTIEPTDLDQAYKAFEHDMNQVVIYFLLCGCAYFMFGSLQCFIMKFVGDSTTYRLREAYLTRLLHKEIQFFDTVSTGHFSTVLNENFERIREVLNEKVALIISLLTDFSIGVAMAFYTDWRLASYGIIFSLGVAFSGYFSSASMVKTTVQQNKHYSNAGSIAVQALGAYKTMCSLNGQRQEVENYTSELQAGERFGCHKAFLFSLTRGLIYFFCNSLNAVIFYFGANRIYDGTCEPAVVIRLFNFLLFGAFCLSEAIPYITKLTDAIAISGPILEVLSEVSGVGETDPFSQHVNCNAHDTFSGAISFQNVRFSYPSRPEANVLNGISFDVQPGESVAIVGASGSGKSTIVQLLLHYYNIDSGDVLIDGIPLHKINSIALRRLIGVVSQEPVLFDTTIRENIFFGNPNATTEEIWGALKVANAYGFVRAFPKGIETVVGERGAQLSGGQKQRIAIARTLIRNPKILVLDEATSALDTESEQLVQEAIENASEGRTTITIAHRLSTIRNAKKILVMQSGTIVESGTHEELLAKQGTYSELIRTQLLNTAVGDMEHKLQNSFCHEDIIGKEEKVSYEHDSETSSKSLVDQETPHKVGFLDIVRLCHPDYSLLFLAVLGSAIQGISYPILAQLIVLVFQSYSMEGEDILTHGHFWASAYMFLALFRPLTLYLQYYYFGKLSERLSTRLRVKSFKHLLSLPCSFYDDPKNSPTRLSSRLSTDSSNVKAAIDGRLGCLIMTSVAISIAIVTSMLHCWQMTIEVLMLTPFLYLARYCYGMVTEKSVKEDTVAFENSNKVAIEALGHIKTVRALGMEDRVVALISDHLAKIRSHYIERAVVQGFANGYAKSCGLLFSSISFKFALFLAIRKYALPMDTYLVLMTISMTSTMAGQAAAYLPDYKKAVHAAGLIAKLLTYPATMNYESESGTKNIHEGMIFGENITFSYDQRPEKLVLDGIDLRVEPGKTLALIGPSGSGKSTIMLLLERFYEANSGELKIDNKNVADINLHHLRGSLALVSQEPVLFNCSIKENLMYGLDRKAEQWEIDNALKTANAFDFVNQFPETLDTIVGDRGAQLSGGQKQRIAIARAILRNPKVLLLDEATSALDSESEKLVQNALDTASERLSTIIVAHRLSTILNADSIAVLKNGRIAEQGTHEELLRRRSVYWRMVQRGQEEE